MAFARPSSAAVLGFSYIDLEQVVQEDHNSKAQKRKDKHTKTTRHTSPQERTRTDKHLNKNSNTEGSGRVQNQFKFKTTSTKFKSTSTSSSRQLQPSSKNMQQTNMLCYDPQLQGYFIWHCHLSHDPLAATSLDHRCTLVQVTYNAFKSSATSCKNIPKTEQ